MKTQTSLIASGVFCLVNVMILPGHLDAQIKTDDLTHPLYRASIAAAEKSLRLNETREAIGWLDQSPESERGWEWSYLRSLCDQSVGKVELSGDATAIDINSAGDKVAIAFADGSLQLYSLPDLKSLLKIKAHKEAIYSVDFSNDGTRLATVSRDVSSRVFNAVDGTEVSQIKLDNPGVAAAAFSPDGTRVATCSWMMIEEEGKRQVSGAVWIWDTQSGKVLHKSRVGVKPLDSIDWVDDGSAIYVGSWDGLVHKLNLEAKETKQYRVTEDGVYTAVIAADVSPNGKWIACGAKDRTVRVWNSASGELMATLAGHDGFVNEVRFKNDDTLISASVDGMLRVWDWKKTKCERLLRGHEGSIPAAVIAPDGQTILTVGRDRTMRQWNLSAKNARPMQSRIETAGTYTTDYSSDGKRIFVACYDGHVLIVDSQTGDTIEKWQVHNGSTCNTLSLSADKQRMLTCSWDKTAKLINTATGEQIANLDLGVGAYDCCISPGGNLGAFAAGKVVELWDLEKQTKVGLCEGFKGDGLQEVQFSPDGKRIAAAGAGGNVCVWEVESRRLLVSLGGPQNKASTVCFSRDGTKIATAGAGTVSMWKNDDSFEELGTVKIGDRQVSNLSFSPDGSRLALAADAIYLVDVARSVSILRFQPNNDDVYYLAYSPDGLSIASCTAGGSFAISKGVSNEDEL